MTDILERLDDFVHGGWSKSLQSKILLQCCADEIRRLREDIANRPAGWEEMVAEIYDLREQVQGLKEALEFIAADDYGPKNRVYHPARAKQALAKLGGDDDTATD